ncbi:hypothetical protein [Clostridium tyrobutyricum]|uniref:hypothetical protein n=1 Tax=Clostridium tyrobutyricum TaxID=1519 RepID=UPI001C3D4ED7|nr:hypothetical protein [Clostridium tyrobutyricum]MBV4437198.1 hypothetical protein [Clostridium tyrobutyricum]
MEFRLNKIDPDVRQRIKETTSAGRVHNKRGIVINKDYKDRNKDRNGDFEKELSKYKGKNKKRIFVEASKVEEVKVNAFKGEGETVSKDDKRGNILDVKK